jgi:PAS domain S-box-containing protein
MTLEDVAEMSRVVLISPFKDLGILAGDVAKELGIHLEIYEGGMDSAKTAIDRLQGPEVDVFISRGGTYSYISGHYSVPVVNISTGIYDIMESCEEARKLSRKIVLTSYEKRFVGIGLLEKAMDIDITELTFTSLQELELRIIEAAAEGGYCLVGGGPSVQMARSNGMPAVFLKASRDTVREALLQAVEVAKLRREEKRKAYRLKTILDSVYDGIVAVDGSGKLEIINPAAERILGIDAQKAVGRAAAEMIPNGRLAEILKTGLAEIGELQEIGSTQIVTNRVPIKDEKEIMGAVATFQDASRVVQVEHRLRREMTKNRFVYKYELGHILGQSATINETKEMAKKCATSDLTLLIYGPTGSGKEMFAQGIHSTGKRRQHPFVAINCAALPPSLLESELFGYDEGAFTGAKRKGKPGLFELAHGGTVFLDEIDALPIELQGRLLRVLQEKEVLRVGGDTILPINVRVIAATNKIPAELVAAKKMREDLYFRLNVLYLEVPSLQDRIEDIPLLCRHFLASLRMGPEVEVIDDIMPFLLNYSWPGNVRELFNFCQRFSFYIDSYLQHKNAEKFIRKIAPDMLTSAKNPVHAEKLNEKIKAYEADLIQKALLEEGSLRKAAKKLGIPKSTLFRRLKTE